MMLGMVCSVELGMGCNSMRSCLKERGEQALLLVCRAVLVQQVVDAASSVLRSWFHTSTYCNIAGYQLLLIPVAVCMQYCMCCGAQGACTA
jgi:hypothetical protein